MPLLEEEGRFVATVTAADLGETKTGTPFLQVNYETPSGYISGRLYLSERAWDYSYKTLEEAFGFDGNFENLDQMVGKECSITTEFENWEDDQGETRQSLRVKWVNAKGGPQMDPNARKSLAARLTERAGRKPTPVAQDTSATWDDDDVPF